VKRDRGLNAAIALVFLAVIAAAVGLAVVVQHDLRFEDLVAGIAPQPSASPSPTPEPTGQMTGNGVLITDTSSCAGCHSTTDGSMVKPIPVLGHPLEGWRNCTACHAPQSLVAVAPGHATLTQDQCLSCHKPRDAANTTAVVPRPHHVFPGQQCTSCHGPNKQAPLPDEMSGRTACWLCHHEQTPGESPAPTQSVAPPVIAAEPLPLPWPGQPVVRPVPSELPMPGDLVLAAAPQP
jgi:hypothetical protein